MTGEPTPAVRWTKDDALLYSTSEIRVEDESSGWSRVVIENTRPEHFGMYTIIAEVTLDIFGAQTKLQGTINPVVFYFCSNFRSSNVMSSIFSRFGAASF